MSICSNKDWTMDLVKEGSPDPETFNFKDVTVNYGVVTGKVYDAQLVNFAYLRGTCSSYGPVGHMTFFFTATSKASGLVDIILFGGALELPNEQPRFSGHFAVLKSTSQGHSGLEVGFDEGDTGTGSGMQAQVAPNRT